MTFINDYLYANIYLENYIVKIDPNTGKILRYLNKKVLMI